MPWFGQRNQRCCRTLWSLFLIFSLFIVCPAEGGDGTQKMPGLFQDFLKGFNQGILRASGPVLTTINPRQVSEATPFTLRLSGSGFDSATRVMIQVRDAQSGQLTWMPFTPRLIDGRTLELTFDKGFSVNPPSRKIYLDNGKGKKSVELVLTVTGASAAGTFPSGPLPATVNDQPSAASPTVTALSPALIQRATPFTLTVTGSGFTADCKVYVEINKNAGDPAAAPVYDFIPLDPVFVGSGELRLNFDRGFGDNPPQRRIYVEDGRGNRSNEVHLTIQP